jgi:hypothetical protein
LRRTWPELLRKLPAVSIASRIALAALALGPLGGCVQAYKPPTADQPHAVLKFRRTYETKAGETLSERMMIDEYLAFEASHPTRAVPVADTTAVLLHPAALTITVRATFSHMERKTVQENYTEQESYTDRESYSCGVGTSFRTCYRTVTRYRTKHKTRWVTKNVPVVDGSCEPSFTIAPRVGGTYLAQFTYQDHNACSLSCFEQATLGDGKFQQRACPSAPLPKE